MHGTHSASQAEADWGGEAAVDRAEIDAGACVGADETTDGFTCQCLPECADGLAYSTFKHP